MPSLTSVLRFLHRLVPVGGFVGALADPAEGDHFGELVLAKILERRLKLFLDAVVDVVVEDGQRAFLLVVDIVGVFVADHSRWRSAPHIRAPGG